MVNKHKYTTQIKVAQGLAYRFSIVMFSSVLAKLSLSSHFTVLLFDCLPEVMRCLEKSAGGPLEVFTLI